MSNKINLKIYCDGGSRKNPGPAASAFVVTENKKVIAKGAEYLGTQTNNVAEYTSVLLAMRWLKDNIDQFKISKASFNLDSQLIQRQLTGIYKIKNENLKKLFDDIKQIQKGLDLFIEFNWSFREKNVLADELVNETLDRHLQREKA